MPARFRAIVAFEGLDTGDKRSINPDALTTRALPLTLMGMTVNPEMGGHGLAQVAGRIETLTKTDYSAEVDAATGQTWADVAGGPVNAWIGEGEFDDGPFGADVQRLVTNQTLRGVSVDLTDITSELDVLEEDEDGWPIDYVDRVTSAEIAAATVCNTPAFRGCTITLLDAPAETPPQSEPETIAASAAPWLPAFTTGTAPALTASAATAAPPQAWFRDPHLDGPTPLTVTTDGRVYGHIADWRSQHIAFPGKAITPPRSASDYAHFHTGVYQATTDDGALVDVPVGHLTLGTGHADMTANAAQAAAHYDDTGTIAAYVCAGEDAHGIWFAGTLDPDLDELALRRFRGCALSGDWRSVAGHYEMVAALSVPVPGFPLPRARVASGMPMALVAAGALRRHGTNDDQPAPVTSPEASRAGQLRTALRIGQARARQTRSDRALRWGQPTRRD